METFLNGIRMAYDVVGEGIPVVLIHGFPLCRRMWHPQMRRMADKGVQLILPDLRGFGDSEAPDGPYSMDLFADDIVALLDHLEIGQAVIGGMSMGGYVLLNLLERYPQRVSAAMFLTTRANADDEAGKARRLQLASDVGKFGPQVVSDAFQDLMFAEESLQERPTLQAEVYRWMVETDSRGLAGGLLAMRERKGYLDFLPQVRVPSLAVAGAGDKAAPPQVVRQIADLVPGCRYAEIPQGGHLANLENPKEYCRVLLEFVEGLKGRET